MDIPEQSLKSASASTNKALWFLIIRFAVKWLIANILAAGCIGHYVEKRFGLENWLGAIMFVGAYWYANRQISKCYLDWLLPEIDKLQSSGGASRTSLCMDSRPHKGYAEGNES
jgi:hypothetical protein